jgi:hypothetical protein
MGKKNWKAALLAGAMSLVIAGSAYAEQTPVAVDAYFVPMQFVFDGNEHAVPEDSRGFIYEGSTYVPLRFISYSLGKAVKWDGETYTVTIQKPSETDNAEINEFNLNTKVQKTEPRGKFDTSTLVAESIEVYKEKVTYIFDGMEKSPAEDLPGFIYNDKLFVPMSFFSQSVGKTVAWNPETYSISVSTKEETKPAEPVVQTPVTETPAAPVVSGGGGGGGGGGSSSSSSSSKIAAAQAAAEAAFDNLRNSCRNQLTPLADKVLTTSKDQWSKLADEGNAIVAKCDREFDSILATARSAGVSEDTLNSYRSQYQTEKDAAQNELIGKILDQLGKTQ